MSSAYKSRDLNPTGKLPSTELGYPAIVRYSFIPSEKHSTEIPVLEGDIVLLEYSVGGWVFVRTYEGKTGYIPLDYCGDLERSQSLRSVFDHRPNSLKQFGSVPKGLKEFQGEESVTEFRSNSKFNPKASHNNLQLNESWIRNENDTKFVTQGKNSSTDSCSRDDYIRGLEEFKIQHTLKWNNIRKIKAQQRGHTVRTSPLQGDCNDKTEKLLTCEICSKFLSRLVSSVQNLAIIDKEKADLKSRKLLKLLQKATQEGLNSIANVEIFTRHNQSHCNGIIEKFMTNSHDPCNEPEPEFGINCSQCQILKDFSKLIKEYSMTDLYATIRDLHIHAMSESDSDVDDDTTGKECMLNGRNPKQVTSNNVRGWTNRNGVQKDMTRNGLPKTDICQRKFTEQITENVAASTVKSSPEAKRSVSFQLEERKSNSDVARSNCFSGLSSSPILGENEDLIDFSTNESSLHVVPKNLDSNEIEDFHNNNTKNDIDALFLTEFNEMSETDDILIPMDIEKREMDWIDTKSCSKFHSDDEAMLLPKHNSLSNNKDNSELNSFENGDSVQVDIDRDSNSISKQSMPRINGMYGLQSVLHPKYSNIPPRALHGSSDSKSPVPELSTSNHDRTSSLTDMSDTPSDGQMGLVSNTDFTEPSVPESYKGYMKTKTSQEPAYSLLKSQSFPSPKISLSNPIVKSSTFTHSIGIREDPLSGSSSLSEVDKSDSTHTKDNADSGKSGHTAMPIIRSQRSTDSDSGNEKRRIIARRFQIQRNPTESGSQSGPLVPKRDDRDIRKTLHDLNSAKRTSTSQKNAPMRAQHSIQVQNPPKEPGAGRTVLVKRFTKQMWRAPVGSDGSDQRPFSPFGGTLPPSKIVKKKVVEVLV